MAAGVTISIKGLDQVLRGFRDFPIHIQKEVEQECAEAATDMVREASINAPHDEGSLQQAITQRKVGKNSQVTMQKTYGIFQEFGTKGKFRAPSYLGSYPAQFKGIGGGSYQDALASLTAWVGRKGITGTYSTKTQRRTGSKDTRDKQNKQMAFLILRKQLKYGMEPHPYFFPAFAFVRGRLLKRLKTIVKEQLRK